MQNPIEIEMSEDQAVQTIRLRGELNIFNGQAFRDALRAIADSDELHVILDLKHLRWIDSAGIGIIVNFMTRFKRKPGARLILCDMNQTIDKIFTVSRIIKFFEVAPSAAEARALLAA